MPYWTIRTELDDAPGRLAGVSGAIAACGGNIVALDVHPLARNAVADELVVEADRLDAGALTALVIQAGGKRVSVTPSDPHDLVDAQTRSMRLLHGLSLATGRRDAALEGALTVLLRADRSVLMPASAAGSSSLARQALLDGLPVAGTERGDAYGARPAAAEVLVVPWREAGGDVRLAVIKRVAPAFTDIEGARARGFLMVAAAVAPRESSRARLLLVDGSELQLRPATALDAAGVAALHQRAPLSAPAVPGVGPLGRYSIWVREALGNLPPPERYVVVAERGGEICGLAGYEREQYGWAATFGLLVDRDLPAAALGSALLRRLAGTASDAGLERLAAVTGLRRDQRLLAARASGLDVQQSWSRDGRHLVIGLQHPHRPARRSMPARAEPINS